MAAERKSVVSREHEVQDDEVWFRAVKSGPHAFAIRHDGGAVAILLQVLTQQRKQLRIVVDDENMIRRGHVPFIPLSQTPCRRQFCNAVLQRAPLTGCVTKSASADMMC